MKENPMSQQRNDPRPGMGLRPIINVSGTMTYLGASIMKPEISEAMASIASEFVEMADLYQKAGVMVAELCDAKAGTVTSCVSAGISQSVAACMAGANIGKTQQLPDTTGMKNEVLIQLGHMVNYGHPLDQAIRIAGASPRPIGQIGNVHPSALEQALNEQTACAVFVVSHHTHPIGNLPLSEFAEICHAKEIPVIVDAASEYDLQGFLKAGADLVIYSGHKFLGGPTSGMVAGREDLVEAVYLQNAGIGRGMKIGKESIVGLMAAITAWQQRDHDGIRKLEKSYLDLWHEQFNKIQGLHCMIIPDPTDNPLDRLRVFVDANIAKKSASELAKLLASGEPPVIVRHHEAELGHFDMDPCNLHPGEAEEVVSSMLSCLNS